MNENNGAVNVTMNEEKVNVPFNDPPTKINVVSQSVISENIIDQITDFSVEKRDTSHSSQETNSDDSQILLESDNSSSDCLESESAENQTANCDLVKDINLLREKNKKLQADIFLLQEENAKLEADKSSELYLLQIETLEKTISQQKQEIQRLQESSKQQGEIFQKQFFQLKNDSDTKLERLTKQYEIANKERKSMVMKFAISEKSVIDLKKEIQCYDGKIKEAIKEKEAAQTKLKNVISEKIKLSQNLDVKNSEIAALERENSKKKDEINMRDSKIKWSQNRLKIEIDSHLETQSKLEKLQQKYNEVKEEGEQYKKQTQALIKSYQEAQEDKSNQEQEQKAKLIIDKHDEETTAKLQLELDNYKKRQQIVIDENNSLCVKIQNLEKERLDYEQSLSKMKQCIDTEKQVVVDLQAQITELESTAVLLKHEQERLVASQAEIERIRASNLEFQQETESCRNREAELLEFTQKLTEKNVRLQSEFTALEARFQQMETEHNTCAKTICELTKENSTLKEDLYREKGERLEEKELLTKHLEEQTKTAKKLAQEVADQQGENQLLKKKHLVTLKELTKELQVCRKKLETFENSQGSQFIDESRTSSSTSLNIVETIENKVASSQPSPLVISPIPTEPDRHVLIDKIVKIQRSNARKAEKIEFLEEHVKQLVAELQKKTRIIQNYIIREQSGALSSETMDQNKVALSKHGGIMASVYNSKAVDDGMTLELSLEINQKLQAVLEDTLLKNITLKVSSLKTALKFWENMETLGNEIARLTSAPQPEIKL